MNQEYLMTILLAPLISEKANRLTERHNQYVFKVLPAATKKQIKQAVETLFEVSVLAVRTINVAGKQRKHGRFTGRRQDWKKAYVKVKEGSTIDLLGSHA